MISSSRYLVALSFKNHGHRLSDMLGGCARKLFFLANFAGESNQVGGKVKSSVEVMFILLKKSLSGA